jgi:hypothetical protein
VHVSGDSLRTGTTASGSAGGEDTVLGRRKKHINDRTIVEQRQVAGVVVRKYMVQKELMVFEEEEIEAVKGADMGK